MPRLQVSSALRIVIRDRASGAVGNEGHVVATLETGGLEELARQGQAGAVALLGEAGGRLVVGGGVHRARPGGGLCITDVLTALMSRYSGAACQPMPPRSTAGSSLSGP